MAKRYTRINWQDKPSTATPINAANLNKMDKGIDDIDTATSALELEIAQLYSNFSTSSSSYNIKLKNVDGRPYISFKEVV